MAKLKFNLLELTSKRIFLDKLMPSGTVSSSSSNNNNFEMTTSLYDEWTNCQTRWTPGDLKDLERRVEGKKIELKGVKEEITRIKEEISNLTCHLSNVKDSVDSERKNGRGKIEKIESLEKELKLMEQKLAEFIERIRPLTKGFQRCDSCEDSGSIVGEVLGIRSTEELKSEMEELKMNLDRKLLTINSHKSNLQELSRLLQHHSDDLSRLKTEESRLRDILDLKQKQKEENAEASLEQLCVWYRSAIESVADLTKMKFEMIRPDYILVTFKSLPVHLNVDPQTGRLLAAQIGTTSQSHNLDWKDLCETAVENNDICTLLHSIQQRI